MMEKNELELLLRQLSKEVKNMSENETYVFSDQEIQNIISCLPSLDQPYFEKYNNFIFNIKEFFAEFIKHFFVPLSIVGIFLLFFINYYQNNVTKKYIEVNFVLNYPQAKVVQIAGDFTQWQPVMLTKKDGFWQISLKLKPGEYKYIYIIDGQPYLDPQRNVVEDIFGTKNSVICI